MLIQGKYKWTMYQKTIYPTKYGEDSTPTPPVVEDTQRDTGSLGYMGRVGVAERG